MLTVQAVTTLADYPGALMIRVQALATLADYPVLLFRRVYLPVFYLINRML